MKKHLNLGFWAVWTGKDENDETVERTVDWKRIADNWQQNLDNQH